MNPSDGDVLIAINSGSLGAVLRGELLPYATPAEINDDMLPTDHAELLDHAIYPLARQHGISFIQEKLERALIEACSDALGVFCAIQCFYLEIRREARNSSPLHLDRDELPKLLAAGFLRESTGLQALGLHPKALNYDRSYLVTLSRMSILEEQFQIDWGVSLHSTASRNSLTIKDGR
jgi:hypothetical protein